MTEPGSGQFDPTPDAPTQYNEESFGSQNLGSLFATLDDLIKCYVRLEDSSHLFLFSLQRETREWVSYRSSRVPPMGRMMDGLYI
jgi:hypothetical protein